MNILLSSRTESSCRFRGRLEIFPGKNLETETGRGRRVGKYRHTWERHPLGTRYSETILISHKIDRSPRSLRRLQPKAAPSVTGILLEKLSSAACISGFRLIFISQRLRTKLVFALGPVTIHPRSTWPLKKRTGQRSRAEPKDRVVIRGGNQQEQQGSAGPYFWEVGGSLLGPAIPEARYMYFRL